MKIVHVITGLSTGGAEMMLYKFLSSAETEKNQYVVISISDKGEMGKRISELGIPVIALGMRAGITAPFIFFRLVREIKKQTPDVVQTWMYHADLLGGIAAKLAGIKNIIWNIRNSNLDSDKTKLHTRLTVKASACLSRFVPKKIISNSNKSVILHQQQGYIKDKFVIIPNGFDLKEFSPDMAEKNLMREEVGISQDSPIIGFVARYDPQKNHHGFIKAAAFLKEKRSDVHFLLIGHDIDQNNKELVAWIDQAGLKESIHLLGQRSDIPRLTSAFDIASLSSHGEAFPNVIGEAMACGVPCVVTDVGDCAWIVGDTGMVVPQNDPEALAQAWQSLLSISKEERHKLGQAARRRVEEKFSIGRIVNMYEQLYTEIAG